MKKVSVVARAFGRRTGEQIGEERAEEIDITTNEIFQNCKTILDIHNAYESFWNELNPQSEEVIFVQRVELI